EGNIKLIASGSANSGRRVVYIANANQAPTGSTTNGGVLYSSGGALTWLGSSGTRTVMGPADPRCPRCKKDVVIAASNEVEGWHKIICMNCLVNTLDKHGISRNEYMVVDKE
ncbi:MAG: hypothetical protein AABY07_01575, partial [Nanoarchaeota archaeon]